MAYLEEIKKYLKVVPLVFLILANIFIWYAIFHFEARQNLIITFFDVGQGDAIFIEQGLNQILIDGGPDDIVLSKLAKRMPFWDRSIDLLILTHPEADHLNGLLEVLKRYGVEMVLETGVEHSAPQYREWRELLKKRGVQVVTAQNGQRVFIGRGAVLDVLSPFENYRGKSATKLNNTSIVSRLVYGNSSVLLTGDAEKLVEHRLLFETPSFLDSDVLKVGHHGSKTSSVEEFLRAVSPDIAVIQVGRKNRYGHPVQEVLDRLATVGAKILRNDLEGDISLSSDGVNFYVGNK